MCDICFEDENKVLTDLSCCIGKKWCTECETKIRTVPYKHIIVKCPFCRQVIDSIYTENIDTGINYYSYSLDPVNLEPSGSVNMTRYPSAKITLTPLNWFNRNPGVALPIVALPYQNITINISLC